MIGMGLRPVFTMGSLMIGMWDRVIVSYNELIFFDKKRQRTHERHILKYKYAIIINVLKNKTLP